MKYGLLINRECRNLGDDIQSYAESLFLPKIDYLVDREYISDFKPKRKDEVVATIMGAWWMHHKWNFPPSKNIYPLWISTHLTNFTPENEGPPIFDELFTGVGGEYMKAYGPVGTRDMATLDAMNNLKIPAYFSGCVTLTLPKQKKMKLKKEYVLLVDLDPRVENKVQKELAGADIEIRKTSNSRATRRTPEQMDDWEFRKKETVELLELYQNAKCVITRRLHVALPCLAMEVPVLCVYDPTESRFSPYNSWLHMVSPDDFLKDEYDYSLLNPKPNKTEHLETRNKLTKQMTEFVEMAGKNKQPLEKVIKTTYSDEDVYRWRYKLMELSLNSWLPASLKMSRKIAALKLEKTGLKQDKRLLLKKVDILEKQNIDLRNTVNAMRSQLYYRGRHKISQVLKKAGYKRK